MTWNDHPLDTLEPPPGKWSASRLFELVHVAHDWGMRPSVLGLCDPEDDAEIMTAYTLSQDNVGAWERYQAEKKARQIK